MIWNGQRLATGSTDRSVKIWQKGLNGKWDHISSVTNSEGPIRKVIWAHPEFGNILASCSMDRSISIYEENKDFRVVPRELGEQSQNKWRMSRIYDDKEAIEDMKFAPKHLGMILAVARADGRIRLIQFSDLMNLSLHQNISDIFVSHLGVNSISWNKNRFEKAMIAVGCRDKNSSPSKNLNGVIPLQLQKGIEEEEKLAQCFKVFVLNMGSSKGGSADVAQMKFEYTGASFMHSQAVYDVSWSLINGRSFHLIGTCGREGAKIWYAKSTQSTGNTLQILNVIDLMDSESGSSLEVWKISWNVMASLVTTSDSSDEIKIFKNQGVGKWEKIKTIKESFDTLIENRPNE